jgi:hypothetical protein
MPPTGSSVVGPAGPSPWCAAWALGSRELGELGAESAVKPVTDSNLYLHGPAQRPADLRRSLVQRSDPLRPYRVIVLSRQRFGARIKIRDGSYGSPDHSIAGDGHVQTGCCRSGFCRAGCWRPRCRSGSHLVRRDYLSPRRGGIAPARSSLSLRRIGRNVSTRGCRRLSTCTRDWDSSLLLWTSVAPSAQPIRGGTRQRRAR